MFNSRSYFDPMIFWSFNRTIILIVLIRLLNSINIILMFHDFSLCLYETLSETRRNHMKITKPWSIICLHQLPGFHRRIRRIPRRRQHLWLTPDIHCISSLIGGLNPSEKYESIGMIIPNISKHNKYSKPLICYWKWPLMVEFPTKKWMVMFHRYPPVIKHGVLENGP